MEVIVINKINFNVDHYMNVVAISWNPTTTTIVGTIAGGSTQTSYEIPNSSNMVRILWN